MLPALSESRWWRLFAFTALYVAQGLPYGVFMIAIPTWLAATGSSIATVANFTAIVALPWSFKLVVAPLMDWLRFPAMGSRRPWVIVAQFGIVLPWLYVAFSPAAHDIAGLTALGFLLNFFGATQDVAVDLVTSITKVAQSALLVTYRLDATSAAGVIPSQSRVVTYTITGGT